MPITNIDYNKELNAICHICEIGLPWKNDDIVMLNPCEHMYHQKCCEKWRKKQNTYCVYCKAQIINVMTIYDKNLNNQQFADMLSMSHYDSMSSNTPHRFLDSLFDIASLIVRVPFVKDKDDGKDFCEQLFALNNLTLRVYGLEKINLEPEKVYISNHVSHLELVVIYYLLQPGFLASNVTSDDPIIQRIKQVVTLLTFNRGDKNRKENIVDQMKKFVEKTGSICLFPEGLMKHPDTLIRFRSGAFHIGKPVYSVTIRHHDVVSDGETINGFVYKLGAKRDIVIEVHILGPYYPPFDEKKIEQVRIDMATNANLLLSRVSNRDVIDKKEKK